MIELARIQNKYLTRENILLKEHIVALKGIIRKMEDMLRSCATIHHDHYLLRQQRRTKYWVWALPLAIAKLGGVPRYRITITLLSLPFFLVRSFW